jgi:hypothetical protein
MLKEHENYRTRRLSIGACILCIIVFCFIPVQAGHWAGVAPDGTQYDVTFTMNNDGSAELQGVSIGAGGTITPIVPAGITAVVSDYVVPDGTGISQNIILNGTDGWAEVIAQDANGNQAHAEVYTDGNVSVRQSAWVNVPFTTVTPEAYGIDGSESGVEAEQCVWSHDFTSIVAGTYGFNRDKSFAGVAASASNNADQAFLGEDGYDCSRFLVHQEAGVSIPSADLSGVYSKINNEEVTYAGQSGLIKNVDYGMVSAASYMPQGVSAGVSGWVYDGNLKFGMGAAARNATAEQYNTVAFNSDNCWLYKASAGGDVEASGETGGANAGSNGPDMQYAVVDANFTHGSHKVSGEYSYGRSRYIEFDLSASGKIYADGDYKVEALDVIDVPCRYDGNVSAWNSQDLTGDYSEFDGHHAGGVAKVAGETGGTIYYDRAHTWPSGA